LANAMSFYKFQVVGNQVFVTDATAGTVI